MPTSGTTVKEGGRSRRRETLGTLQTLGADILIVHMVDLLSIDDLLALRASSRFFRDVVERSKPWELLLKRYFPERNALPGTGFNLYARRSKARIFFSCRQTVNSGPSLCLQHGQVSKDEYDILMMKAAMHARPLMQTPYYPLKGLCSPVRKLANCDLFISADGTVRTLCQSGTAALVPPYPVNEVTSCISIGTNGKLSRLVYSKNQVSLGLKPIQLPVPGKCLKVVQQKNTYFALIKWRGVIYWSRESEECSGENLVVTNFENVLACNEIVDFAVTSNKYVPGGYFCAFLTGKGSVKILDCEAPHDFKFRCRTKIVELTLPNGTIDQLIAYKEPEFLAIANTGAVFGINPQGRLVEIAGLAQIKQITCGVSSASALTAAGDVLSWDVDAKAVNTTWAAGYHLCKSPIAIGNPVKVKLPGVTLGIGSFGTMQFALVA